MENTPQERQRVDDVLYKYNVPSHSLPLITTYNLISQKWLLDEQYKRQKMINGIGPSNQIRSNMPFAVYHNNVSLPEKEKTKDVDKTDRAARLEDKDSKRKEEKTDKLLTPVTTPEAVQKGALVFATNHNLQLFLNFNELESLEGLKIKDLPMEEYNPICVDFAPFLSRPFTEKKP
jgi:hypothetical protein